MSDYSIIQNYWAKTYVSVIRAYKNNNNLPDFNRDTATLVFNEMFVACATIVMRDVKEAHEAFLGNAMDSQVMRVGVVHECCKMAKEVYTRMGVPTPEMKQIA